MCVEEYPYGYRHKQQSPVQFTHDVDSVAHRAAKEAVHREAEKLAGNGIKLTPEAELSNLLIRCGVPVAPHQIRLILLAEWRRITRLAHKIHDAHSDE